MTKSESIKELASALCKAQSQMKGAKKDAANPFFKTKYADLASVWEAAQKPLNDNGLSIIQATKVFDGRLLLETILLHSSGEFLTSEFPIKPSKDDAQSLGSATSYARRYALAAMVCIVQDDDDGEAAVNRNDIGATNAPAQRTYTRSGAMMGGKV